MSARQSIAKAIVEKLKGIDGNYPCKSNLYGNCSDRLKWWSDINDFPYICVVAGREDREYLPSNFKWGDLNISLKVYVKDSDDPQTLLENLLEDVERVIDANYCLSYGSDAGEETANIEISHIITDEGLLIPYGVAEVALKIKYQVL